MSIQVGRSLGVARTVVRIDFLVKSVAFYPQSKDTVPSDMHRKQPPRPGAKTKRVSAKKSSLISRT